MSLSDEIRSSIRTIPDFPKPGIQFRDITPLLSDTNLSAKVAKALAEPFMDMQIDVVAGIESRGFLYGVLIAQHLGCGFSMIRKKGKLPYRTVEQSYALEYGEATIEMHIDAIQTGQRVLIHDDLLATGGTAEATANLIRKMDGEVAGFNFVVELDDLDGRSRIQPYTDKIVSIVNY